MKKKIQKGNESSSVPNEIQEAKRDPVSSELLDYFGNPETPEEPGIVAVSDRIHADLLWLFQKARTNNKQAFARLLDKAVFGTQLVKSITDSDIAFAKAEATKRNVWPVSVSNARKFPQDIDALLKTLELDKTGEIPFDVFKRFSNHAGSPARGLLVEALLLIFALHRIKFFTSTALGLKVSSKEIEECLSLGEVPPEQESTASSLLKINDQALKGAIRGVLAHNKHAENAFARLVEKLCFPVGTPEKPTMSQCVSMMNHSFPLVHFHTANLPIHADPFVVGQKINAVLKDILELPPLSPNTRNVWQKVVEAVIFAPCGKEPLASSTLRSIGGSSEEKSHLQATGGDVAKAKAFKAKGSHKKSPETNILNTTQRVLRKAFYSLLRDNVVEDLKPQ